MEKKEIATRERRCPRGPEIQFEFIVRISGSRRWNVSGALDCVIETCTCVCVCVGNRIFGSTLRLRTMKKFEQSKEKLEAWSKGQGRAGNETRGNVAANIFVIAPRRTFRQKKRRGGTREMYFAVAPQPLCYHRLNSTGILLKMVSTLHHCFAWIRLSQAKAFWHNFIRGTGAGTTNWSVGNVTCATFLLPPSSPPRENTCVCCPAPLRL